MIKIKNKQEIEIMKKAGEILAEVMREVLENVRPGVLELELDRLAEKLILEKGGQAGFKMVRGYEYSICSSVNNVVVHGIPTKNKLKIDDVIGIDCGVYHKGFHSDMSETIRVLDPDSKIKTEKAKKIDKFLETGKRALEEGIKQAKVGNHVGHISKVIQEIVEKEGGYSVVRSLVGHGVGRQLHEDPEVPGFLIGKIEKTPLLKEGMVIAIEVIYNQGKGEVVYKNTDGWTIVTEDGSISGVFERTVAITKNGPEILTK